MKILPQIRAVSRICTSIISSYLIRKIICRQKPCLDALKQFNIAIISDIDNNNYIVGGQAEVFQSVELLYQYDFRRFNRVKNEIRFIFIRNTGPAACYIARGRICILNIHFMDLNASEMARQIACAGILVHEATHLHIEHLGVLYFGANIDRIEFICDCEEKRCVEKLKTGLSLKA